MSKVLTMCKNRYVSLRGFHTKRHLVVIESDDWGSIRMPSADILRRLKQSGDHPENDPFLSYDCLENGEDLQRLFDVLNSVRDSNGSSAVITANFATANPNFDAIDPEQGIYAYEPFYETYQRYGYGEDVLSLIRNAMRSRCFIPQLHCREHLNVNRWMKELQQKKKDVVIAFQNQIIGINASFSAENPFGYMDAFNSNFCTPPELKKIVCEALQIFEHAFLTKSKTFAACCFVWDDALEEILAENGIQGIQSGAWQLIPSGTTTNKLRRKLHFTGECNRLGQVYTVRNCAYEPARLQNAADSAEKCYRQILDAFHNHKPAVINSHRVNYIGSISEHNAQENLKGLVWLLKKAVKEIPDLEFVSTEDLLEIINQEKA